MKIETYITNENGKKNWICKIHSENGIAVGSSSESRKLAQFDAMLDYSLGNLIEV